MMPQVSSGKKGIQRTPRPSSDNSLLVNVSRMDFISRSILSCRLINMEGSSSKSEETGPNSGL